MPCADPELQRFYPRKLVQKGLGKARVAAARKLGIRLWIMLRDQIHDHEFCLVGERWQFSTCRSAHLRIPVTGEVLGTTSLQVGRHREPVLHARGWCSPSTRVGEQHQPERLLDLAAGRAHRRQRETVDITQPAGPLGSVRYTEQMGIMLLSAVPVR